MVNKCELPNTTKGSNFESDTDMVQSIQTSNFDQHEHSNQYSKTKNTRE